MGLLPAFCGRQALQLCTEGIAGASVLQEWRENASQPGKNCRAAWMYSSQIHIRVREGKALFHRRKTLTGEMFTGHRINAHKYTCFVYYMGKCIPNVDEQKVNYSQFVKNRLKYCYICGKIGVLLRKVQMSVRKMKFFQGHPAKGKQRQCL